MKHSWQEDVSQLDMQAKPMPAVGKVGEGIEERPQGSRMLEEAKFLQPVAMMRKVEAMVDDSLTKFCGTVRGERRRNSPRPLSPKLSKWLLES